MDIASIFLHVVESFRSTLRLPPRSILRPLPELRGAPQLVIVFQYITSVNNQCGHQFGLTSPRIRGLMAMMHKFQILLDFVG